MRKQKIIKMTASPLDPSLGGSFQPPATHNGDISIVFRDKNMSIHGWDGSAWSTIYTRNVNDKQFTFPHTYESYYVKSLTGSDETFSASFFSVDAYQGSTPLLAGVQRDTKLYDIEEVPVYTASDASKLLTIMSDGSLRWLGISESYVVEVIGTDGEAPVDSGTSHVSAHLEENGTLFGNAAVVDGILVSEAGGDYTRLAMTDDYRSSVNQTISFWFKSTYNPSNGTWMRFVHSHIIGQGPNGFFIEMRSPTKIYFKGATQGLLADNDPTAEAPYALNDGEWHQITVSWQDSGSEALRMWVDGQPLTVLNETHVGSGADTKPYLFIGARQFGSPMEMDKVGITEEFIDDAEALARYNSEAPAEAPATILWEDKFTLKQDASLYDDGDAGNVMNTGVDGYATSYWSDHLTNLNPDQMIVSFWFKCNGSSSGADRKLFGLADGYKGVVLRASATSNLLTSSYSRSSSDGGLLQKNYDFSSFAGNEWYNVVMTLDKVAGTARTYLNGVMVSERTDIDSSASWVTDGGQFSLGSNKLGNDGGATGNSFDFDSFQVAEGFVLTDEQIASIYNDGSNREVVIASDM